MRRVVTLYKALADGDRIEGTLDSIRKLRSDRLARIHRVASLAGGVVSIERDFVPGRVVSEVIGQQVLPYGQVVAIGLDVLSVLSELHAHGLVHRAVQPSNLVMTDLGLCFLVEPPYPDQTAPATEGCEPRYRDPQVARHGWAASSDLYSLSICLWELATGSHPFEDGVPRPEAIPPSLIPSRRSELAPLIGILQHTMAPCTSDRVVTADLMAAALADFGIGTRVAMAEPPPPVMSQEPEP